MRQTKMNRVLILIALGALSGCKPTVAGELKVGECLFNRNGFSKVLEVSRKSVRVIDMVSGFEMVVPASTELGETNLVECSQVEAKLKNERNKQ